MSEETAIYQLIPNRPSALDTYAFKEIEQFSKEVCHDIAKQRGDYCQQPLVMYGLIAFLTSVKQALQRK